MDRKMIAGGDLGWRAEWGVRWLWKSGEKVGGKVGGKVAEKLAGRGGKVGFAQFGVGISTGRARVVERFARRFTQGFTPVTGRFCGFYT